MSQTQSSPVLKRVEDANAGGVAENAEGVGQCADGARRHQRRAAGVGVTRARVRSVALFGFDRRLGGEPSKRPAVTYEYMSKCSYIAYPMRHRTQDPAGSLDTFFAV